MLEQACHDCSTVQLRLLPLLIGSMTRSTFISNMRDNIFSAAHVPPLKLSHKTGKYSRSIVF